MFWFVQQVFDCCMEFGWFFVKSQHPFPLASLYFVTFKKKQCIISLLFSTLSLFVALCGIIALATIIIVKAFLVCMPKCSKGNDWLPIISYHDTQIRHLRSAFIGSMQWNFHGYYFLAIQDPRVAYYLYFYHLSSRLYGILQEEDFRLLPVPPPKKGCGVIKAD